MWAHDSSRYGHDARVVVPRSIAAGEMRKWRLSSRRRQILEPRKVTHPRAGNCGKDCRALWHAIRQVTRATTFFIEPSNLLVTSDQSYLRIGRSSLRRSDGRG